jgi:hypothetical protein
MASILRQTAAARSTEGGATSVSSLARSAETKRQRGRPKGAKNTPKPILPKQLALELVDAIRPMVTEEQYLEMSAAVKAGKGVSTLSEAKIMLKLMGPSLMKRLIEEQNPNAGVDPELLKELGPREIEFKKDTNERINVWMRLLELVYKMETKEDASTGHNQKKPLVEIFAKRGFDSGRLAIHVNTEPIAMGGDVDGIGREAISARTVSDKLPERPFYVQDSE